MRNSKILFSVISAVGAIVIMSIPSIDEMYGWPSYILSILGMLLIINPTVVDILHGFKEQGALAWQRRDFRKNCIILLLLVAFICFLNFVYGKSRF